MADNSSKRPSRGFVSDADREKMRKDAEYEYRNVTGKEDVEKALNKIEHPNSGIEALKWLLDQIGKLINFAKVITMSVFLGRQETNKRINVGNLEAEKEKQMNQAKKEAKIEVLQEKIQALDPEKAKKKEEEEKTNESSNEEPGKGSEENPNRKPEEEPNRKPDRKSEDEPEKDPEKKPDKGPENKPDRNSDEEPKRGSEGKPDGKTNENPKDKSDRDPKKGPENKPEKKPENKPPKGQEEPSRGNDAPKDDQSKPEPKENSDPNRNNHQNENRPESPKAPEEINIFKDQVNQASDLYREMLRHYLARQMGISDSRIEILNSVQKTENNKQKKFLVVQIDPAVSNRLGDGRIQIGVDERGMWQNLTSNNRFLEHDSKELAAFAGETRKAVMNFTKNEYDPTKDDRYSKLIEANAKLNNGITYTKEEAEAVLQQILEKGSVKKINDFSVGITCKLINDRIEVKFSRDEIADLPIAKNKISELSKIVALHANQSIDYICEPFSTDKEHLIPFFEAVYEEEKRVFREEPIANRLEQTITSIIENGNKPKDAEEDRNENQTEPFKDPGIPSNDQVGFVFSPYDSPVLTVTQLNQIDPTIDIDPDFDDLTPQMPEPER